MEKVAAATRASERLCTTADWDDRAQRDFPPLGVRAGAYKSGCSGASQASHSASSSPTDSKPTPGTEQVSKATGHPHDPTRSAPANATPAAPSAG